MYTVKVDCDDTSGLMPGNYHLLRKVNYNNKTEIVEKIYFQVEDYNDKVIYRFKEPLVIDDRIDSINVLRNNTAFFVFKKSSRLGQIYECYDDSKD